MRRAQTTNDWESELCAMKLAMKRMLCLLLALVVSLGCALAEGIATVDAQAAGGAAQDAAVVAEGVANVAEEAAGVEAVETVDVAEEAADAMQEAVTDVAIDPDEVKMLQIDLIGAGYLDDEADGLIGSATQAAIRAAQEALGLPVNGLMSDELSAALRKNAFPMKAGDRSSMVFELQKKLYSWGFLEEEPTGYYGDSTVDAVTSFQTLSVNDFAALKQSESDAVYAAMDTPADVAVDLPLFNQSSIPCDGVMTQEWYDFMVNDYKFPRITAKLNDESEGVKMVQKRLHALGYLYTGLDGTYGSTTELAMKYFQRKNGLPETGGCDDATSEVLFSESPERSEEYVMPYMAYVVRSQSRVYIFGWDGEGYNTKVTAFKCSCGARSTPTIKGTYYCEGPISEWYYMAKSVVWVKYAFKIKGNYFFHSVLFKHKGNKYPTSTSVHNLGSNVSHGCIRLAVDDAKWLYENCTPGMKVVID